MTAGLFCVISNSSFPDTPLGADPESITADRGYGFRARSLRSRPGMTDSQKALRIDVDLEFQIALCLWSGIEPLAQIFRQIDAAG